MRPPVKSRRRCLRFEGTRRPVKRHVLFGCDNNETYRDEKGIMPPHSIYSMSFAKVYPLYVAKAEKKGRTKAEVDEVIRWLTGYSQEEIEAQLERNTDFESFFAEAPQLNPSRTLIKGVICGVRVEDIEEPTMREIRYLDKLIDELAKGKAMDKILRKPSLKQLD